MEELLKVVIVQPKPKFGEDPKSILCQYFKAGKCTKGFKCIYSHDLTIENKAAKKSLYTDTRDEKKPEDDMSTWDQEKLEKVVAENNKKVKTQSRSKTICKFFLDAIENEVYGWFWKCPNGGDKYIYYLFIVVNIVIHYLKVLYIKLVDKEKQKQLKKQLKLILIKNYYNQKNQNN